MRKLQAEQERMLNYKLKPGQRGEEKEKQAR